MKISYNQALKTINIEVITSLLQIFTILKTFPYSLSNKDLSNSAIYDHVIII
jgi:hypothetical protein